LNVSLDELKEGDWELLQSPYPGPECLRPDQVLAYGESGDLTQDQWDHVADCTYCAKLLAIATPDEHLREAFLNEVRESAPKALPATKSRSNSGAR
jgi:hypothetical protein